jgi:hypothetical protein
MKRLLRVLVLSAGVFALLQWPGSINVKAFDMECVAGIETSMDDYCASCCWNSAPTTIATYSDGGSGAWCYTTGSVNCNGVLDPNNCTAGMCGTFQYSDKYQSSYCCSGNGGACTTDAGCCSPYLCGSGGFCRYCINDGLVCTADADCCSGFCDPAYGRCNT